MSLFTSLPSTIRITKTSRCIRRSFHVSSPTRASIFFALSALSNSRETQHFNKLTRLPRIEHSPPLKLIKTSEVDSFPLPTPPVPVPRPFVRHVGASRPAHVVWNRRALQVGRVFIADQARQTHRLVRSLARAKRRAAKLDALQQRNRLAWQKERQKMRNEMRAAGMWILLSVGTATALAMWRFWPETGAVRDSADLGRRIAARAVHSMPLPAAIPQESPQIVSVEPTLTAPIAIPVTPKRRQVEELTAAVSSSTAHLGDPLSRSWWKGLFWKQ